MSAGCAWLVGGTRWLGAGRKLAHRGRADDQLAPPAKRTVCSSSNRAAGDSQPPAHRLGTTQDPAGDAPAEGRVARRVNHALIDRLIQFFWAPARPSRRRKSTVHSDLCDKRGSHKSPTHRGPEGMHPWRAPGTTRPRQLSHKSPREPEICSGKESEAMRATKNEEGRGVRAKACGVRAVGCSSIMCGQPVARVQRTKPRRKTVGDFYLPKRSARSERINKHFERR